MIIRVNHRFLLLIFALLITIGDLSAQYYILGQDPASIKWNQISSPTTNIIFPEGFEESAQRYANLIEVSHKSILFPYINSTKQLKIVLHNRTVVSNAMVSPTPFHADFFSLPDQNTYAQLWDKQLSLHEYRHAVQMQKLNQGTTKVLKALFGDQAIGAIMGVFLPFWFIEGDAVFIETIYSESGRGRSPDFTMDLKAQIIDKGIYPYDKALYGSYKDYTPDHYTLGYQLVTYGTLMYGEQIWNNTLNKVARKPYTFVPFTNSLKKITGTGKVNYYKNVLSKRRKSWEIENNYTLNPEMIAPKKFRGFTDYRFPTVLKDGSIIAEKSGIDDINRFVRVFEDGSEEIIFTPGFDFNESLSANDSLICWNEREYDPRWSNRTYSVIKLYNYKTRKKYRLSTKSRLFAPNLANTRSLLVAVDITTENVYSLVVIDIDSGEITWRFNTDDNLFFMYPSWSYDDRYIVATVLGEKGKSIIKIDYASKKYELLLPWSFINISRPIMVEQSVKYTGSYNGTDNIYSIDLSSERVSELTNVPYGANDVSLRSDDSIVFVNYTADGFRLSKQRISKLKEINPGVSTANYLIDEIDYPAKFNLDLIPVPDTSYPVKKYSKIKHLFNLHSWGLAAVDLNNYYFQPGVNILTQNILSTAWGSLGYYYDPNEQTGKAKFDFTYAGWYPMMDLSVDFGKRKAVHLNENDSVINLNWYETNIGYDIYLPLNFTRSKWIKGIQPGAGITQKFLDMIGDPGVSFREPSVTSLSYWFNAYVQQKRSLRDIYPVWGFYLSANYRHTPFSDSVSNIYGGSLTTYIPGLLRHHGIRIYTAYQKKQKGYYSYSNIISTPRGYTGIYLNEMMSIKTDYALPLFYPDLDIQAIAYLKRITLRGFYDYLTGKDENNKVNTYSSVGMELYSDWHFFSLLPNISLGVRGSYRLNDNDLRFEFLYGFTIN